MIGLFDHVLGLYTVLPIYPNQNYLGLATI